MCVALSQKFMAIISFAKALKSILFPIHIIQWTSIAAGFQYSSVFHVYSANRKHEFLLAQHLLEDK